MIIIKYNLFRTSVIHDKSDKTAKFYRNKQNIIKNIIFIS
jgi:hypothetical protein